MNKTRKYPHLRRMISDSCEDNISFVEVKKSDPFAGIGILPNYISQIWEYNFGQIKPKATGNHKVEVFPMGIHPFISKGNLDF